MNELPSFGLDRGETPSARQVLFAVACWLLAVVSGVVAVVLAMAGVMSSDSCRPGEMSFLCTSVGQGVVWWLPLAGWGVSILVAWVSVVKLGRGSRPRWFGLAAGLVVYSAVLALDWFLVAP